MGSRGSGWEGGEGSTHYAQSGVEWNCIDYKESCINKGLVRYIRDSQREELGGHRWFGCWSFFFFFLSYVPILLLFDYS